eukprot:UN20628
MYDLNDHWLVYNELASLMYNDRGYFLLPSSCMIGVDRLYELDLGSFELVYG